MTALGDGTRCVHGGMADPVPGTPLLASPVFATAYHLGHPSYGYGRADNPTWRALESAIGDLDGGECVVFSSGMAAISAVLELCTGKLVLPSDGYYLTRTLAQSFDAVAVPTAGPWPSFAGAGLVLLETPSNPGLDVCDITALASAAHAEGALLAVDNTTATPLGQRPLELGADIVVSSDTKALSGHSDILLGHVTCASADLAARIRQHRTVHGSIPGPFETWLAHRGLGTLDLRLARQATNAAALYSALQDHPLVSGLRWPGAPADPAYPVASRQMRRFGGVLTFTLPSIEVVDRFLAASKLVTAATSFGGLHTTADRRAQWGDPVPPGLVRLSAGCEDTDDLLTDIQAALNTT
ncbi:cystathionine gamma-lyase [Kibdelosporangium banguiense]|uniref:Cystathionine gamma-lyase n=1 Tax=Kibdelosporangium banguiense TaxID=1365924 RepID=A0ABS4TI26_9PSEU|nr:cystathionine gamma-lyase [Kibdelosporangium banguiense]MBP2323664.1 cystathionine gamma-lyase [Kibdelosporangium banguiense]